MKKHISWPILVLLVLFVLTLGSCNRGEVTAGTDEIILSIRLDTPDDVYQIAIEYWSGDTFCGGVASSHADGSSFESKEVSSFVFDPSLFPEEKLPGNMTIAVMLADSLEHLDVESLAGRIGFCEPCEYGPFDTEPATVYHFILKGSFSEGFSITAEI